MANKIGDIHFSPPAGVGSYEDALVLPGASRAVAGNADLAKVSQWVTGEVMISNNTQSAASADMSNCVVFNGQIYGVMSQGNVKKRANSAAAWSGILWGYTPASYPRLVVADSGPKTRMLQSYIDQNTATGKVVTVRSEADRSAPFDLGVTFNGSENVPNVIWRSFEVSTNVMLGLVYAEASLRRTVDDGVSWSSISTNLNNPAPRWWCGVWRGTGNNIHMIGRQMAIATSVDDGASWTVNASVPNATNILINSLATFLNEPAIGFDYVNRVGLVLDNNGMLKSFNLDNPTAGYTNLTANSFFPAIGGGLTMFATTNWFLVFNSYTTKPGLWGVRKGYPLGVWKLLAPLSRFPASVAVSSYTSRLGLEVGDGRMDFPLSFYGGSGAAMAISFADTITQFDRYVVVDPNVPSGRKPFVRVA